MRLRGGGDFILYRGDQLMLGGLKIAKLGQFWKIIAHSRALTQPSVEDMSLCIKSTVL